MEGLRTYRNTSCGPSIYDPVGHSSNGFLGQPGASAAALDNDDSTVAIPNAHDVKFPSRAALLAQNLLLAFDLDQMEVFPDFFEHIQSSLFVGLPSLAALTRIPLRMCHYHMPLPSPQSSARLACPIFDMVRTPDRPS